ncbi:hypothetical protein JZ751_012468 [Albula glossodonta]|uniref:Uncharacterized protein n=1 Tax=Albula glossodonta TaxID=121402 RepID=A0A8T2P2Z7_9TELE|nr:hypothetical protein JZ751_012468 [Albula glossodonta]
MTVDLQLPTRGHTTDHIFSSALLETLADFSGFRGGNPKDAVTAALPATHSPDGTKWRTLLDSMLQVFSGASSSSPGQPIIVPLSGLNEFKNTSGSARLLPL